MAQRRTKTKEAPRLAVGGYDNARPTRLRPGASGPGGARGGSADSQRDPWTLDVLRRQTQHLDRNNVVARGIVQAGIDAVVSDGFNLQFHTPDKEWNARAEELLNHAFGWPGLPPDEDVAPIDIRGLWSIDEMAAEIVRCAFFDGDIGFVKTESGALQAIEAERIVNPGGPAAMNTALYRGGVELDAAGRPLRYWVAEWSQTGQRAGFGDGARGIAAEHFLFLRNPMRGIVGSTRGEPQMAAALDRLERIAKYNAAASVAAELQASMAGFIKSTNPAALQASMAGETVERPGDTSVTSERYVEVSPGMFKFLGPLEEVQYPPPTHPIAGFTDYVTMQVMQICMDLRIPVSAAMLDGRGLNLSTIRSILQFSWRNTRRWQGWLTRCFYTPVTTWRTAMFIRSGKLPFNAEWHRHSWTPPPPPVMDPKTEIDAARAAVDSRFKSRKRVMLELFGIDWETESEQIAREMDMDDELGIAPVGMPGQNTSARAGGGEDLEKPESGESDGPDAAGDDDRGPGPEAGGAEQKGKAPPAPKPAPSFSVAKAPAADAGFLVGDKTLAADLVKGVSGKTVPAESAKAVLTEMVKLTPEQAQSIIGPAEGFEVPQDPPAAPDGGVP